MKVDIPKGSYIKGIEVNDTNVDIDFQKKKKVALVFISLNDTYWPYVGQVLKDCRKNFLPHHSVDYFVWTDFNQEIRKKQTEVVDGLFPAWEQAPEDKKQDQLNYILNMFAQLVRLYAAFYQEEVNKVIGFLVEQGLHFKIDGQKHWIESNHEFNALDVAHLVNAIQRLVTFAGDDLAKSLEGTIIVETEGIQWPSPTLLRYHLFLNQEEKLKEYDYIFYLDADMRVVDKISDEILNKGLLAAEHPMYSLRREYIPPYEPNKESTAYIPRPGQVVDDGGKLRFKPYYYAGGFQGGTASEFLKAMRTMKKNIDKDQDNNGYIAIWNDESHWNKYLSEYTGDLTVLSPAYVYPDSLIKEYYEPIWGCSYTPKIITLTKPFTLTPQGGEALHKFMNSK